LPNQYTGEYQLKLGGQDYTIKFSWRALGDLKTLYPQMGVQEMLQSMNPYIIADMIVCGAKEKHPELTQDKVLDLDIPIIPVVEVLDEAITAAYLGPDKAKEATEEAHGDKKKTK